MKMTASNNEEATMVKLPVQRFSTEPENFISELESWVKKMWGKSILLFDCETATQFVTELKYLFGEEKLIMAGDKSIRITLPDGYLELEKKNVFMSASFFLLTAYINKKNQNNYILPTSINFPNEICIAQMAGTKKDWIEFEQVNISRRISFFESFKKWATENTEKKVLAATIYDLNMLTNILTAKGSAKKIEETKHNGIVYINFFDGKKIEMQAVDLKENLKVYYLKSVEDGNGNSFYQAPFKIQSWSDIQFLTCHNK